MTGFDQETHQFYSLETGDTAGHTKNDGFSLVNLRHNDKLTDPARCCKLLKKRQCPTPMTDNVSAVATMRHFVTSHWQNNSAVGTIAGPNSFILLPVPLQLAGFSVA
jgi:hypothetical protein